MPPLLTFAVTIDAEEASFQPTLALSVSPGMPVQVSVAVTVCPVCAVAGLRAREQLGGAGVTVTVTDVGVTVPAALFSVVSVTVADSW